MAAIPCSARAVLMTGDARVLLVNVAGHARTIWITPGGRIERGETALAALARELREETGYHATPGAAEIWTRRGDYLAGGHRFVEDERFFLVRTGHFDPAPTSLTDEERAILLEFRWWTIDEILHSAETFVPARLGTLLRDLSRNGPPARPIDVSD